MSTVVEGLKFKATGRTWKLAPWMKWGGPAAILMTAGWFTVDRDWLGGPATAASGDLLTYEVQPRDLPITVLERGSLESQANIALYCEVDDVRSDGINGTPIIWIIENGSSVEQGQLICELDSSAIQSELDDQIQETEESRSARIQAQANLDNQEIQNATNMYKAELDVQLATLELEMFEDQKVGSHQLAVELINRQVDDLNNEILTARMNKDLLENEMQGIEDLFKLGYAGKSELDRSKLNFLQAEGDYSAKLNKLKTQQASSKKLDKFDKQMQLLELKGKLKTNQQAFKQVSLSNQAKLSQMKGILASRTEQLNKEEERLARYQAQLIKCKIFAPQAGMVAYASPASSRDSEIAEGVPVRPRQHMLSIPNLQRMQVKTKVHESVLDRIEPGLKVAVTVDAFSDRSYTGTVKQVAVLPARSSYSDTKTYETIIEIDEEVDQLKPGMTAVCDIKVDYVPDATTVPIQSIVQRAGNNWLYIDKAGSIDRRRVTLGQSNDQYVLVTGGVEIGERVVLNPNALADADDEPDTQEASPAIQEGMIASANQVSSTIN